jgi:ABC-type spermidine/putrescine transport system permease subunit I
MKYAGLMIGLTIGNFIYQAFQAAPNWGVAAERSFFQITTLLLAAFMG